MTNTRPTTTAASISPGGLTPLRLTFFAAVLAYVVSFFLPVTAIMDSHIVGWQAAVFSVAQIGDAQNPISLFYAFLGLSNLAVVVAVIAIARRRPVHQVLLGILIASTIGAWAFGIMTKMQSPADDLYIGYYLWAASYPVITFVVWSKSRVVENPSGQER